MGLGQYSDLNTYCGPITAPSLFLMLIYICVSNIHMQFSVLSNNTLSVTYDIFVHLKPIFHQAFFGRVGTDSAIDFVLGPFQIFFSSSKY